MRTVEAGDRQDCRRGGVGVDNYGIRLTLGLARGSALS